jgi:hypothetical protein
MERNSKERKKDKEERREGLNEWERERKRECTEVYIYSI